MKRKTIITLIVALFLSMTTTKVFATNNTIDSLNKETVGFTSASPNDTNNQVFPQQKIIAEKSINRENILFWVTILTPFISIIMLLIAILQLSKQRSDSKENSASTNTLLKNLNQLIKSQEDNANDARNDRLNVLVGLRKGVMKINTQIFNNVLTDIAIKKQEIRASCNEICFYFKRNPHVLKENYAIQDNRVINLVDRIENSISTLEEMFICYGFYDDVSKSTFNGLTTVIERLKNEPGIAPTKPRREAYLNEIITAENEMMDTVNSKIIQMRTLIEENNE